jgi:hypothetical protein
MFMLAWLLYFPPIRVESHCMSTITATGGSVKRPSVFPYSCGCKSGGCLKNNTQCGCIGGMKTCNSSCGCSASSSCRNPYNTFTITSESEVTNANHLSPETSSTVPSLGVDTLSSSFVPSSSVATETGSPVVHKLLCVQFNVNGIYKRTEEVVQILKFKNISFVGLQEIRVSDFSTDKFSKLVKTINKKLKFHFVI